MEGIIGCKDNNNSKSILSKSTVESQIAAHMIKFHKEVIGRGPHNVKVDIVKDMIIIRLKGVLAISEKQVVESNDGSEMIRCFRRRIEETNYTRIIKEIEAIIKTKILHKFTDIIPTADEKVTLITLEENIEEKFNNY